MTPALFARAPDAKAMAGVPVDEIQQYVRLVGLAPTKAKNIAKMSELLLERHGGKVPSTFQELEALVRVLHVWKGECTSVFDKWRQSTICSCLQLVAA